jgi:hypothetical protein
MRDTYLSYRTVRPGSPGKWLKGYWTPGPRPGIQFDLYSSCPLRHQPNCLRVMIPHKYMGLPLGLTTVMVVFTTSTVTCPLTFLLPPETAIARPTWPRFTFCTIADLFKPVPAAGAPAFWTKKTSSVGGYQTTASWNRGSPEVWAMTVRVGLDPMIPRKSGWYTWNGRALRD